MPDPTYEPLELCDLIQADLLAEFGTAEGKPFESIERAYLPLHDLKPIDRPRLIVCPGNLRSRRIDRRGGGELAVDIAIQKKLTGSRNADSDRGQIDAVLSLFGTVDAFLRERKFQVDGRTYHWQSSETDPLFSPEDLSSKREVIGVLELEYSQTGGR